MRALGFLIAVLGAHAATATDQQAVTLTGKRVILMDDGQWKYDTAKEPNEVLLRGVAWGCHPNRIKQAFPMEPLIDDADSVGYAEYIAGSQAFVRFALTNGVYTSGLIDFYAEHSNKNLYLSDFETVNKLLTENYGEPFDGGHTWYGDFGRDNPDFWGTAVAMGNLSIMYYWNFGKVRVAHMLSGDNHKIEHRIHYNHEDMTALRNAVQSEADKEKL